MSAFEGQSARILGLCGSCRGGRWAAGADKLVGQILAISSEENLREFLREESTAHLENFMAAGREESLPFDRQYQNIRKKFGSRGLCNSEVVLAAALWSAKQLGCRIDFASLSEFFPVTGEPKNLDTLRAKLLRADGLLVSTPVYFGDRSSLVHDLIRWLRRDGALADALHGRVYAGLAVGAKRNGGQETTLIYQILDMVNAGLLAVGNDGETTSQYGGTCHAGDVGTAWQDDYGLWTSMGAGRRIARVAQLLRLSQRGRLNSKLRVGFWLTQDRDGFALKQIERIAGRFRDRMEPVIFDVSDEDFTRCLACDICPRDIGTDPEYRCVVSKPTDFFVRMHKAMLNVDAIAPVAVVPKDPAGVHTTYQRFNERTRYFRRGDYVFTDVGVAPTLFEEVGVNDSLPIRILTSMIRHHTVMTKPIIAHVHQGEILNDEQIMAAWEDFITQATRLTVGRLARSRLEIASARYNPVGYVLSTAKDKEDEALGKRREMIAERVRRMREMADERLSET